MPASLNLKRGFGQNLLISEEHRRTVARCAFTTSTYQTESSVVIEIGAGPGGLTSALFSEGVRNVFAIEQDRQFIPMLNSLKKKLTETCTLNIIEGDARKLNFYELTRAIYSDANSKSVPIIVVGNLPYSAATAILQNLLNCSAKFNAMALMFQKEVAQRICASIDKREGTKGYAKKYGKGYGRLSVLTQMHYHAEVCCNFPPQAFFPTPKVHSQVVKFIPNSVYVSENDYKIVGELTSLFFSYKRKKIATILRNAYKNKNINNSANPNNNSSNSVWLKAGETVDIDFSKRPEDIPTQSWLAWARAVGAILDARK